MITSLNPENKEQFEMYSHLFAKAYDVLAAKGKLTEAEVQAGRFTSLDNYFAHMADLIQIDPTYIMLPLDEANEGVFKINANDRTIAIPPQFVKCAAVKNDEKCEIIVFSIDRYFDYQDLDGTAICVQWVNAAGEEGISHIQLKDLETMPGKIRFGWPLTSSITKKDGPVQFAVRFYNKVEDKVSGQAKYHYLLNTLTSTITVRNSLSIEDPVVEEENVAGEFAKFVKNSMNPTFTQPAPVFFVAPGLDLEPTGAIDPESDTLVMTAQAVANDAGIINYEWMFIPAGSDAPEKLETAGERGKTVRDGYSINHQDWKEVKPEKREGSQKYYTKVENDDGEGEAYKLYIGEIPAPEGTQLYICRTTLTIEPGEHEVVGEYYVNATNSHVTTRTDDTGVHTFVNSTAPSPSRKCLVPAPNKVEFTEDGNLPKHMFIDEKAGTATLAVKLVDDPTLPDRTYQWSSSTTTEGGIYSPVLEATKTSHTTNTPGWYKIKADSKLNRKTETATSAVCKVTKLPAAPKLTHLSYALVEKPGADVQDESLQWNELTKEDEVPKSIDVSLGNVVRLKVETDLDKLNPLQTESLTYKWYVQIQDELQGRPITEADKAGGNGIIYEHSPLHDKYIDVRCVFNGKKYNYYCVVTNTIQNKSATYNTSDFNTFVIE